MPKKSSRGVRYTLLEKLLLRPRPILPDWYFEARHHLFPGLDDFKSFLQAQATEEQTAIAKRILARLVHHNRLAPPNKLLLNLLDFESVEAAQSAPRKGEYVARDHFNHLVHLYLLGVYFFAYHSDVHAQNARYFNQLRRRYLLSLKADEREAVIPENIYVIFGTAWSSFVLYHDIGYPLEKIAAHDRENKEVRRFLVPFEKICDLSLQDLVLRAAANLIVAYSATERLGETTLGDIYFDAPPTLFVHPDSPGLASGDLVFDEQDGLVSSGSSEKLWSKWGKSNHLPNFYGHRFRAVLSLFPDEKVCAILEHRPTGRPVAMVLSKNPASQLVCFFDKRTDRPTGIRSISARSLATSAFISRRPPAETYEWHFFGLGAKKYFKEAIEKILPKSSASIKALVERFETSEEGYFESVLSWGQGREASFVAFRDLREHFAPFDDPDLIKVRDEVEEHYASVRSSLAAVLRDLPKNLGDVIADTAARQLKEGDVPLTELFLRAKPEDAIGAVVSETFKERDLIVSRLAGQLEPKVRSEIKYFKALHSLKDEAERLIRKEVGEDFPGDVGGFERCAIGATFQLSGAFDGDGALVKQASEKLVKLGLPDWQSLVSGYQPDYLRGVDHGLASAVAGLTMTEFFNRILNVLERRNEEELTDSAKTRELSPGITLLRLAFLLDWAPAVRSLRFEEQLLKDAVFAAIVHNLYPKYLPKAYQDYKTGAELNPFVFLCLLCDGLQEWDRGRQQNQGRSELRDSIYGDRFDVQVDENLIIISVWGRGVRLESEKKNLRENLSLYLKGVDQMIRLSLSEV